MEEAKVKLFTIVGTKVIIAFSSLLHFFFFFHHSLRVIVNNCRFLSKVAGVILCLFKIFIHKVNLIRLPYSLRRLRSTLEANVCKLICMTARSYNTETMGNLIVFGFWTAYKYSASSFVLKQIRRNNNIRSTRKFPENNNYFLMISNSHGNTFYSTFDEIARFLFRNH